ncbi:MAG: tetratricopeptide repeat protein [Treponema sp.]|jgi:tetratricopeptide (TPR) repeat protein|nr:tetratricopeptide repeat protein [Treponema sp.]
MGITKTEKKYELAIQDFTVALGKTPNAVNTLWLRAQAYESVGKLYEAIKDYDRYIQLEPDDREAYFNIGLIYEYLKNYENALNNYKKANGLRRSDNLDEKIELMERIVSTYSKDGGRTGE